jgi:ABC-type Zn uptake system ZnuABC Zn-binding protein ZnuA
MMFYRNISVILLTAWLAACAAPTLAPTSSPTRSTVESKVASPTIAPTDAAVLKPTNVPQPTEAPKPSPTPKPKLKIATTVEPLFNIVYNIGGSRIELVGIVPPGTDSHTFEPAPSDAIKLSVADIIFVNGLFLEEPTLKLAKANLKEGAEIVQFGENTVKQQEWVYDFSFPKSEGKPNPHLWMNPLYALRYAEITKDTLSKRDPENASFYAQNYSKFKTQIEALDAKIKLTIESIPQKNRRLLTYHDSFAYFAPRYGVQIIGAIQPSSFAEPTPREVAQLIQQIKSANVPAIFGSEVFPSKVLEQIKKEAKVEIIETLSDDALPGKETDANHTYVGMMVDDVMIMAKSLGGKPELIASFDVTNTAGK